MKIGTVFELNTSAVDRARFDRAVRDLAHAGWDVTNIDIAQLGQDTERAGWAVDDLDEAHARILALLRQSAK